jgi:hypothetical protein
MVYIDAGFGARLAPVFGRRADRAPTIPLIIQT